jgi:D-beta-D-heptose 7-phosphate kinase/D-beta-D-heptose 1-phosphate adenosyltransferase
MNKILVIGDSCEDVFTYGYCKRLSPEAPVPVLNPAEFKTSDGMAANVYNNIKALGAECDLYTNNDKPVKTRYVEKESNQTLLRVDEWDEIHHIFDHDVLDSIRYMDYDAIVISDYNKGYLWEQDITFILSHHPLTFLDSKKQLGDWCKNARVIKINEKEYESNLKWITESFHNDLVVTLGSRGSKWDGVIFPIEEQHPVRDLTGAGDTYLAALVVEYLRTNDIHKAVRFANKCAAWVVTQKGVTVVDLNKMK